MPIFVDSILRSYNLLVASILHLYLLVLCFSTIFVRSSELSDYQSDKKLALQGWVTLQLTRDPVSSRGFFSARSVTGLLSDVYSSAAGEVGKIHLIADEKVCEGFVSYTWIKVQP